jgi:hypothetical protein
MMSNLYALLHNSIEAHPFPTGPALVGLGDEISDFELAPKIVAPFIIFFCGLGSTIAGIFLQIRARGWFFWSLGAVLIFAGPLGALGGMWLWALRLL